MITGTHTYLRSIEESDIALIREWNYDPEISRYFDSRLPISLSEQKKWFEAQLNSDKKRKLIIEDKDTHTPIGLLGIMQIDHLNKNCEIGITIGNKAYWGKSYARDAMAAAMAHLFEQYNMHVIYLTVLADNARAVSFFKKCGFAESGILKDMVYKNGAYHSYLWMYTSREAFVTANR